MAALRFIGMLLGCLAGSIVLGFWAGMFWLSATVHSDIGMGGIVFAIVGMVMGGLAGIGVVLYAKLKLSMKARLRVTLGLLGMAVVVGHRREREALNQRA